jgi:hypothetical protein
MIAPMAARRTCACRAVFVWEFVDRHAVFFPPKKAEYFMWFYLVEIWQFVQLWFFGANMGIFSAIS